MKKLLFLVFILSSFTSFGQFLNYTNINGRYKWIAGKFDSTFTLPSGTTPSLRTGGGNAPGALFYNTADSVVYQYTGTQWTPLRGSDTGKVQIAYVRNTTGSSIATGKVVYINGSTGNVPTIALANNKQDSSSAVTFGIVRATIPINGFGWVTTFGPIDGINTNAYTEGEPIYLDSISGNFTHYKPQAPYHLVYLGYIVKKSANGIIFTKIQNGYELEELHNVRITGPVLNKSVLIYDSTRSLWVDTTVSAAGLGVTQVNTNSATGITGGPITLTGTIAADTLLLSTRLWRQKGIDSVTSLINARPSGSGTTNYVSKWTSSSALGNSLIYDNGTSVGIGTTSPSSKLTVNDNTASAIQLQYQGNAALLLGSYAPASGTFISEGRNVTLTFQVGSTDVMKFFGNTGNIGIGTGTNAGYRLDVTGTFRSTLDANINGLTVGKGGGSILTNTAFGISVISGSATGTQNTGVGYTALRDLSSGSSNTAVGQAAGRATTTGANNVFMGFAAGIVNVSGGENTAIGTYAGYALTGPQNTAIGYFSGGDVTSGQTNTFLGHNTGRGITTGNYNTIIGASVTGLSSSLSNTIILADGQGNQRLYIDNSGYSRFTTTNSNTIRFQDLIGATNWAAIYLDQPTPSLQNFALASEGTNTKLNAAGGKIDFEISNTIKWSISASTLTNSNTFNANVPFWIKTSSATGWGMIISASASQTQNLLEFRNSSDATISTFFPDGSLALGTGTNSGYRLDVNGTARVQSNTTIGTTAFSDTQGGLVIGKIGSVGVSRGYVTGDNTNQDFAFVKTDIASGNINSWSFGQRTDTPFGNTSGSFQIVGAYVSNTGVFNAVGGGFRVPFIANPNGDVILAGATANAVNGNVGVGAISPAYKLDITGSVRSTTSAYFATSSGAVGIGTTSPNASALLDLTSTTKGFAPPRMTGLQAEAIATPTAGLLVYANNGNGVTITSTGWWGYDGTTWVKLN